MSEHSLYYMQNPINHPDGYLLLNNGSAIPAKNTGKLTTTLGDKNLFFRNAFLFWNHRQEILSDSSLFLTPINAGDCLADDDSARANPATLGVYIEWWMSCDETWTTDEDDRKWLVVRLADSMHGGINNCTLVNEAGKMKSASLSLGRAFQSLLKLNRRYEACRNKYDHFSLEEAIDFLVFKERSMETKRRIVLNIPHSSVGELETAAWNDKGKLLEAVRELTDWHTDTLFRPSSRLFDVEQMFDIHVFPKSRFVVDAERLIDDPLEEIGQGIIYHAFTNGMRRSVSDYERERLMNSYEHYHRSLRDSCVGDGLKPVVLVDCHSFAAHYGEVDVCIGFNENFSKPADHILNHIIRVFEARGYSVALNTPYSNAIQPLSNERENPAGFCSIMLEMNKRTYMDEKTLLLNSRFMETKATIDEVYRFLLWG